MGLFSKLKNEKNDLEKSANEEPEPEPETEAVVRVERQTTSNKAYTEHTAEVTWNDGSTEEIVFDEMERHENSIVLSNYKRYNPRKHVDHGCGAFSERTYHGGFEAEKFLTLSMNSFRTFETIEREEELMEFQEKITERKRESEVEEDEYIIEIVDEVRVE